MSKGVLTCGELESECIAELLDRFGIDFVQVPDGSAIPASYWRGAEAGIRGSALYARVDTPLHSLLHELAHIVCMTGARRARLDCDAGGDDDEESAVCYLQLLLADHLTAFGRERCFDDMDVWGYSFRQGEVRAWFEGDGQDARAWLVAHGLIDAEQRPLWRLRD